MPATALKWDVKSQLRIHDHVYEVHSLTKEGFVNLICLSANDNVPPVTKSEAELIQLWNAADLEFLGTPQLDNVSDRRRRYLQVPFDAWPKNVQDIARRKYIFVKAFVNKKLRRKTEQYLTPLIEEVAKEHDIDKPPSVRQLQRWIADWESIGSPNLRDIRIFAPRFHDRGKDKKYFHPTVESIMHDVANEKFLISTPHPVEEIFTEVKRRVELVDATHKDPQFKDGNVLRSPSRRTIYRFLASIDDDVRIRSQEGVLAWERKCKPVIRGPQATRPMEQIEIDHTDMDIWVIDYDRNVPLGRPYLTLAIDRYSRMIVGFYISFRRPNVHSVMKCLYHVIRPKDYVKDVYPDIQNEWPCFSKPGTIITDNGAEFHSANYLGNLHEMNIDIQINPAKKPWYKGIIERMNETLNRITHKIDGTTLENTQKKGDRNPVKAATVSLDDLVHLIHKHIIDDYHQRWHSTIRDTPLRKWNEGVKQHQLNPVPRISDLDALLSAVRYCTLTREGVQFAGLKYCEHSRELEELINRADKPAKVKVRYDENDLSHVFIQDWRTHEYLKVPSIDPEYTAGLSIDAHTYYCQRDRNRRKAGEKLTIAGLMQTRREVDEIVADLKRRRRRRPKRVEAIYGKDPNPGAPVNQRVKAPVQALPAPELGLSSAMNADEPVLHDEITTIEEMFELGEELSVDVEI